MSTHPIPVCPICYAPQTDPDPEKNTHRQNCANRSKKDMLADIEWFKTKRIKTKRIKTKRIKARIKARNDAEFWQAKFHTLRLENNGLRRRLRKQAAPAPSPEPQWHNPAGVVMSTEDRNEGWRLLTPSENPLPDDAQYWSGKPTFKWWNVGYFGGHANYMDKSITYRTQNHLPK